MELRDGAGLGIASYLDRADHVYAVDDNEELLRRVRECFGREKVTAIKPIFWMIGARSAVSWPTRRS